ncbi:MAG TPA: MCP four helix bundle domain-containing protein [Saprospiraceae bacterium]|nr:MCP four helix bundle domain-containing protein [Saprospiraceae bacterium]HMP24245.1 MCP four helix bundle domain-containing protein [Saprospiraceae bacterium]
MDWVFSIRPKIKVAFLLALICVAVLLQIAWERYHITNIDKSFSSIYEDRLLPASYIFHLTDHLYKKRLMLEKYFIGAPSVQPAEDICQLEAHNAAIEKLLCDFDATYLIEIEGKVLHDFKQKLLAYNTMEMQLLQARAEGLLPDADEAAFLKLFAVTIDELTQLSQIQTDVGKKMKEDTQGLTASTSLLANMEAALVIVIGLVIQALVFASRTVAPKIPRRHDLN